MEEFLKKRIPDEEKDQEKTMRTRTLITLTVIMAAAIVGGCGSKQQVHSGFLSDYTKLQEESKSFFSYFNDAAFSKYSAFIIDPVKLQIYSNEKTKGKLTQEQLTDLTNYMHVKIVEAFQGAGKKIAYQPADRVARVRVALTDIQKTHAINMLPQASLMGAGIGGASMEAEVVDSMTGQQIGAVVQSKLGSRIPFSNLGDWRAAKNVLDAWGKRFQKRLSE
ncbi:MAG: DUF3313 domain-containing protein [Planctomycetota bacterium]